MKKRSLDKKLLLSKETIRSLISEDLELVAAGVVQCRKISFGGGTACDCSGGTDTCGACSTIQY
jgi:hypothetical protein